MPRVKLPEGAPIPADALEALRAAEADERHVRLACGQLPRDTYELVDEVLRRLGGKWKGGRTRAHAFDRDPRPGLAAAVASGAFPPDNPLAFFATPPEAAESLVLLAASASGFPCYDDRPRILEPSAGDGALVAAALSYWPGADVTAIELDPFRAALLAGRHPGVPLLRRDFLDVAPEELGPFDLVLMNPPFATPGRADAWIDHLEHAWRFLARSCSSCLVAVCPNALEHGSRRRVGLAREFVLRNGSIHPMAAGSFKESGTGVVTVMACLGVDEAAELAGGSIDAAIGAVPRQGSLFDGLEELTQ
jgi:predicted RNA methylase